MGTGDNRSAGIWRRMRALDADVRRVRQRDSGGGETLYVYDAVFDPAMTQPH